MLFATRMSILMNFAFKCLSLARYSSCLHHYEIFYVAYQRLSQALTAAKNEDFSNKFTYQLDEKRFFHLVFYLIL